jgi:DNA-binding response OmpR family regulator
MTVKTVLLVDDDESLLRLHQLALTMKSDLEVRVAQSGRAALDLLNDWRPDLVILDLMMPDMNGLEVCRRLRAQPALATVPVVMLTGLSDSAGQAAARQAGASDVWLKPMTPAELRTRIGQLLG